MKADMKDNVQKINISRELPYLVANVVEILDLPAEDGDEEEKPAPRRSSSSSSSSASAHKCAVVKSSLRYTYFLPEVGLVDSSELHPGDLIGVNKDTHLIIEKLPPEYDSRVTTMEIDERPTEDFTQIGGLDKQIEVCNCISLILLLLMSPQLPSNNTYAPTRKFSKQWCFPWRMPISLSVSELNRQRVSFFMDLLALERH